MKKSISQLPCLVEAGNLPVILVKWDAWQTEVFSQKGVQSRSTFNGRKARVFTAVIYFHPSLNANTGKAGANQRGAPHRGS